MTLATELDSDPGNGGVQVGDWWVAPALDQVWSAGKTVKLEPKAMSVLMILVERAGQVVSRDSLLSAVWPGVIVGDDSLTQVVIKLRKALGDDAGKPAYIQTISKRGYRLIAPVTRFDGPDAPISHDPRPVHRQREPAIPWMTSAAVAALVLVAAGAWWASGAYVTRAPAGNMANASDEAVAAGRPSVAIKPFEALDDDPRALLLARGVTADLVTDLSKVSGLSVIDVAQTIGAASNTAHSPPGSIRYLVSGSVQRVDERLRLNVRLTDAQTGQQLSSSGSTTHWTISRNPGRARARDTEPPARQGE